MYEKIMSGQDAASYVNSIVFHWHQHSWTFLQRKMLNAQSQEVDKFQLFYLSKEAPTAPHMLLPYKH